MAKLNFSISLTRRAHQYSVASIRKGYPQKVYAEQFTRLGKDDKQLALENAIVRLLEEVGWLESRGAYKGKRSKKPKVSFDKERTLTDYTTEIKTRLVKLETDTKPQYVFTPRADHRKVLKLIRWCERVNEDITKLDQEKKKNCHPISLEVEDMEFPNSTCSDLSAMIRKTKPTECLDLVREGVERDVQLFLDHRLTSLMSKAVVPPVQREETVNPEVELVTTYFGAEVITVGDVSQQSAVGVTETEKKTQIQAESKLDPLLTDDECLSAKEYLYKPVKTNFGAEVITVGDVSQQSAVGVTETEKKTQIQAESKLDPLLTDDECLSAKEYLYKPVKKIENTGVPISDTKEGVNKKRKKRELPTIIKVHGKWVVANRRRLLPETPAMVSMKELSNFQERKKSIQESGLPEDIKKGLNERRKNFRRERESHQIKKTWSGPKIEHGTYDFVRAEKTWEIKQQKKEQEKYVPKRQSIDYNGLGISTFNPKIVKRNSVVEERVSEERVSDSTERTRPVESQSRGDGVKKKKSSVRIDEAWLSKRRISYMSHEEWGAATTFSGGGTISKLLTAEEEKEVLAEKVVVLVPTLETTTKVIRERVEAAGKGPKMSEDRKRRISESVGATAYRKISAISDSASHDAAKGIKKTMKEFADGVAQKWESVEGYVNSEVEKRISGYVRKPERQSVEIAGQQSMVRRYRKTGSRGGNEVETKKKESVAVARRRVSQDYVVGKLSEGLKVPEKVQNEIKDSVSGETGSTRKVECETEPVYTKKEHKEALLSKAFLIESRFKSESSRENFNEARVVITYKGFASAIRLFQGRFYIAATYLLDLISKESPESVHASKELKEKLYIKKGTASLVVPFELVEQLDDVDCLYSAMSKKHTILEAKLIPESPKAKKLSIQDRVRRASQVNEEQEKRRDRKTSQMKIINL